MDTERVAAILPQKMEPRTQAAAVLLCRDSGALGDHLILYSRDSVELIPAQPMMETGEEREKRLGMARRTWGGCVQLYGVWRGFYRRVAARRHGHPTILRRSGRLLPRLL